MLYHYAMTPTIRLIQADGLIRANPQTLFADMFGREAIRTTPPIVWLTLNPLGEGTTLAKAQAAGYRGKLIGDIGRIAVDESIGPMDLAEYTESVRIPLEAWRWVLATADMTNIDPSVWRICPRNIAASEWLAVEVMTEIDTAGTTWGPV